MPRVEIMEAGGQPVSWVGNRSATHAEQTARITELEDALRKIAAGEVDEGGNIRPCDDAMQIAHKALWPNG